MVNSDFQRNVLHLVTGFISLFLSILEHFFVIKKSLLNKKIFTTTIMYKIKYCFVLQIIQNLFSLGNKNTQTSCSLSHRNVFF